VASHYEIQAQDQHRGTTRVRLVGEIDLAAQSELARILTRAVTISPPPRRIEVDLTDASLLTCATIGTIISTRRLAQQSNVDLYLTGARGMAARVLQLTSTSRALTTPTA
jgi:anti-anti-sigma factor